MNNAWPWKQSRQYIDTGKAIGRIIALPVDRRGATPAWPPQLTRSSNQQQTTSEAQVIEDNEMPNSKQVAIPLLQAPRLARP